MAPLTDGQLADFQTMADLDVVKSERPGLLRDILAFIVAVAVVQDGAQWTTLRPAGSGVSACEGPGRDRCAL